MSPSQVQESSWVLIYENDAEGNQIQGDKEKLIQALRQGKEIRIAWVHQSLSNPKIKVGHLADAKFLTLMSDQTILAQIGLIVGQSPYFETQEIFLKKIEMLAHCSQ